MKAFRITQLITDRQDASLGIYLRDVSKFPLISQEEEIKLGEKIKKGDKKALNKLVSSNLRFVISVAKQYQHKGLPLVDLIQIGNLALITAAHKWDETRGFKFISYAVWWIRQAIIHALSAQCRTVRVPMNQVVSAGKINKVSKKLEQELGRNPSIEEISEDIDLSTSKINFTLSSFNKTLSLDMPFKDEEDGSFLDVIPNENITNTDSKTVDDTISKELERIINTLSFRERDTIKMVFGIGMEAMTLEEVGSRFGIVTERVRQIQNGALKKLRDKYGKILKTLL